MWSIVVATLVLGAAEPPADFRPGHPVLRVAAAPSGCAVIAAAYCARLAACSSIDVQVRYGDAATCERRQRLACEASRLRAAELPGAAHACAGALCAQSCRELFTNTAPPACVNPTAPTFDLACSASALEQAVSGLDPRGVCAPAPSTAMPAVCGPGIECWAEAPPEGTYVEAGGRCGSERTCAPGLGCVGADGDELGTCRRLAAAVGAPCDGRSGTAPDCDRRAGLFCNPPTGRCAPIAFAEQWKPCGRVENQMVLCRGGASCMMSPSSEQGTCELPAADGAQCDWANGPYCLPPARCIVRDPADTSGRCRLPELRP